MTAPLSVLVLTMNEELNIAACLDSIVGWAADIVVVDSGSTDRTADLCAERGVRTVFHPYVDHRTQKDWALTSIPWRHEWLLLLDADHVVTPDLRQAIERMLHTDRRRVHGYYNRHIHYFRNRRVRGLKRYYLQLVRRSRVRIDETDLVDGRLIVDGPTAKLPGAIIENNQKELDIDFWIDKHQKFARRIAIEEILRVEAAVGGEAAVSPRVFGHPDERSAWLKKVWYGTPLYLRAVLFFLYRYLVRLGFLDGWNGLVFHGFQTFWFRLLVDVNIENYRAQVRANEISLEELSRMVGRGPVKNRSADAGPALRRDDAREVRHG
ncbi:MAG: hypothetical protein A3I61_01395 [Acidobacteria bacterium RIFCSPLOWO2_02_FULL_68_18]|nr:MAG: hypothetical protein A3I61_01395 [Acidobacteria bacterium RIFCSPLOWO2_02_FULL_68_18]OFW51569.1 MAG: hypothetical protein A3G77_18790 [Acidobacteria bacterium RIFCSPLOWO2_12_FULL_68_19]